MARDEKPNMYLVELEKNQWGAVLQPNKDGTTTVAFGSAFLGSHDDKICTFDTGGRLHGKSYWRPPVLSSMDDGMTSYYFHGRDVTYHMGPVVYNVLSAGERVVNTFGKLLGKAKENKTDSLTVEKILAANPQPNKQAQLANRL